MSTQPVTIDVPHRLGRAGARERLRSRIGDLDKHIPGGMAEVRSGWASEDEMTIDVTAMGQHVSARLEVQDTIVRVHVMLPPMLAFFSGMISTAVREGGERMLEDKSGS
jgi:hypothetical protein